MYYEAAFLGVHWQSGGGMQGWIWYKSHSHWSTGQTWNSSLVNSQLTLELTDKLWQWICRRHSESDAEEEAKGEAKRAKKEEGPASLIEGERNEGIKDTPMVETRTSEDEEGQLWSPPCKSQGTLQIVILMCSPQLWLTC